jgi:tetratricopeptide (TPR) repeat protein
MEKLDLILYILIALIAFHILGGLFRTYNGWYREGGKLYSFIQRELTKGNFESVLSTCSSHLERRPHDGQLLYFKAKALYKLGKNEQALTAFEELKHIEPVWSQDADSYIQSIKSAT